MAALTLTKWSNSMLRAHIFRFGKLPLSNILTLFLSSVLISMIATTTYAIPLSPRVELLTDAPVQLGIGGIIEGPVRLRLRSSIGLMPSAYVAGSNAIIRSIIPDDYSEETAQLVEETIQDSLVWRTHLGWRPFAQYGFYLHTGYTWIGLGGGSTAKGLIEGITGTSQGESSTRRGDPSREPLQVDASATLHMWDVELGWEWLLHGSETDTGIQEGLILRAAIGWSYTFASSAELAAAVEDDQPRLKQAATRLEEAGEEYLVDTFDSYIHPPSLTLALGYQW